MTSKSDDIGRDVQEAAHRSQRTRSLYDQEKLLSGFLGSFRLFKRDLDRLGREVTKDQADELILSWDQLYNLVVRLKQTPEADQDLLRSIDELEDGLSEKKFGESARLAQRIDNSLKRQSAEVAVELSRELTALVETTRRVQEALRG